MTRTSPFRWIFCSIIILCLEGAPASAQSSRTWVSGLGTDSGSCPVTSPCMTFAFAYSQTTVGGEIDVLSPGGYGALTITHSISIYDDGSGEAGILVAGNNGITVSAGPTDVVNLRGLIFNGTNAKSRRHSNLERWTSHHTEFRDPGIYEWRERDGRRHHNTRQRDRRCGNSEFYYHQQQRGSVHQTG